MLLLTFCLSLPPLASPTQSRPRTNPLTTNINHLTFHQLTGSISSFGPGSAFGFAPVTRQPRRTPSSGSYTKDPALTSPTVSGPQPVDHHAPTLGAWGADPAAAAGGAEDPAGRSFSSILAPIPDGARVEAADPLAKPFVYSREFLLGLYDEEKARRRPIELVANELATRDAARKPWALEDWREGEKEVSTHLGIQN